VLTSHQNDIAVSRYHSDPHSRINGVFTDSKHIHQRRQRDWTRDQCVTVAQLGTGHSPLLPAYLHHIGRRDSATRPHCNGAEETVEHLVFQCPADDQARRETWPGHEVSTDLRRLWSFLERIGWLALTPRRLGV